MVYTYSREEWFAHKQDKDSLHICETRMAYNALQILPRFLANRTFDSSTRGMIQLQAYAKGVSIWNLNRILSAGICIRKTAQVPSSALLRNMETVVPELDRILNLPCQPLTCSIADQSPKPLPRALPSLTGPISIFLINSSLIP